MKKNKGGIPGILGGSAPPAQQDDLLRVHRGTYPGQVRLAACGTAQAPIVKALYFPGFKESDACRDIGDSVITETAGIGGFAMAAAPALVTFIGGVPRDAINTTLDMYEITYAEHKQFSIPYLDFRGTPTGIDIRKVVEKQITPRVNTGVAHKEPGVGQVGAGVVSAPMGVFEDALVAFADRYGF